MYNQLHSSVSYAYRRVVGYGTTTEENHQEAENLSEVETTMKDYGALVVDGDDDNSSQLDTSKDSFETTRDEEQHWEDDDDLSRLLALKDALLAKTNHFDLPVDPNKGYKAKRLSIFRFGRPHMRAFHGSWILFNSAWLLWFSMSPLLPIMKETSIDMTQQDIWLSNMCALVGTIVVRLILGPLCDEFGGKDILVALLVTCAIPCGLAGALIHNFASLVTVRSLIGCVGGTLVPAQFWVSCHFTPECAGVAMATAAGWGALGGGLAQVLMGSIIYPSMLCITGDDAELSWRLALTVPAILSISAACFFYNNSDDSPLGSYKQVREAGLLQQKSAADSFRQGIFNLNAWILFVQFGAQLGIELVMESSLTGHLANRFDLSLSTAAGLASMYGMMNLFARGLGGFLSDRVHKQFSLRGRLFLQMVLLFIEGTLILGFIRPGNSLQITVLWMVVFASCGQMGMGNCFGMIPYIDPRCTGTIAGIVAAGGNFGGVLISNVFRTSTSDLEPFHIMAYLCFLAAVLTPFIAVSGFRGIWWGTDQDTPVLLTPAIISSKR